VKSASTNASEVQIAGKARSVIVPDVWAAPSLVTPVLRPPVFLQCHKEDEQTTAMKGYLV
jgi:hypothetical protein